MSVEFDSEAGQLLTAVASGLDIISDGILCAMDNTTL